MAFAQQTVSELERIVGKKNVLTAREDLIPYSFDGTAALQQMPGCVVLATSAGKVAGILRSANQTQDPCGDPWIRNGAERRHFTRSPIASCSAWSEWIKFSNWIAPI